MDLYSKQLVASTIVGAIIALLGVMFLDWTLTQAVLMAIFSMIVGPLLLCLVALVVMLIRYLLSKKE
jgi:multisubunit Na+/H+ antiporter MnhG subunit